MINWVDPKMRLPDDGEIVATITNHKGKWPESFEIQSGEASYSNDGASCVVFNHDWTGYGSHAVNLKNGFSGSSDAVAWAPASEFNMPEWAELNY